MKIYIAEQPDPLWAQALIRLSSDPKDVLADLFEELLLDDPRAVAEMVIERLRDAGFVIVPAQKAADSFSQLANAEAFLKSQGFWLVADSCDWTNIEDAAAGIYAIDGRYGTVKAWRVEIIAGGGGLPDEKRLKREIERLQDAKRRALSLADERAKEAVELRLENERLKARLAEFATDHEASVTGNYCRTRVRVV